MVLTSDANQCGGCPGHRIDPRTRSGDAETTKAPRSGHSQPSESCIQRNIGGFFRNTLLIQLQGPDASVVMGYRAWQALGHQVRKGSKSISILAPCTYKTNRNENEDQEDSQPSEKGASRRVLRGFRIAHVFDISSTDGDTVRPPAGPTLLDGEAPAGLGDALAAQITGAGFTLTRDAIPSESFRYRWDLYRTLLAAAPTDLEENEPDGYDRATGETGYRTFAGEVVKSHSEWLIANFLYLSGVRYVYERPYDVNVADATHSQHRPDFYYPDIDVWHEHWALGRDGKPPVAFQGYADGMAWKRRVHAQNGTTLVEST